MTRKLRRRPNDPSPSPDKRRKPAPAQLNYLLTDEQIMEDLRTLNKVACSVLYNFKGPYTCDSLNIVHGSVEYISGQNRFRLLYAAFSR
uniref:Uncharacterized protein n=1 Tax=Anguilla anguilla TaxID=7936 RepID=A0A0E9UKH1_ANGAN